MFKSFTLWMEDFEKDNELRRNFLRRLGLTPEAQDLGSQLNDWEPDELIQAISSIGLTEDAVDRHKKWIMSNRHKSFQVLLNLISASDLDQEKEPTGVPHHPGKLPPPQPERPEAPMYSGGMPPDGGAAGTS